MTNEFPVMDEIESLARHEEALALLYSTFAGAFPVHYEFWNGLADEEKGHASWIRQFKETCKAGQCNINEGRFRIKAIETSTEFINRNIQSVLDGQMTAIEATSLAVDIEHALIDRKFFEVFESDDDELRKTLNFLAVETDKHIAKVEKMLETIKQPGDTAIG